MHWCPSFGSGGSSSSSSISRISAVQTAQLCLVAVIVVALSLVRISTDTLFQLAKNDDAVEQKHLFLQLTSNAKSATPRQQPEPELDSRPAAKMAMVTTLRYDWTSLKRLSPLAQRLALHQHNCLLPFVKYEHSASTGLGSGLHVHSAYLCHAVQEGQVRLKSTFPWIWLDLPSCALEANVTVELYRKGYTEFGSAFLRRRTSAMSCYFSDAEPSCPQDELLSPAQDAKIAVFPSSQGNDDRSSNCDALAYNEFGEGGIPHVRAAATELYFTRVSPLLQREAERQLQLLFGKNETQDGHWAARVVLVPPNLITVHMRWGDKGSEMELQSAEKYVQAVHNLLAQRRSNNATNDDRYWNDSYTCRQSISMHDRPLSRRQRHKAIGPFLSMTFLYNQDTRTWCP